jgi:hypothetical protein
MRDDTGSRRNAMRTIPTGPRGDLPYCDAIVTYVDGMRINDAIRYLSTTNAQEFESFELLTPEKARGQFGASVGDNDVLVLWTKGRGPHAPTRAQSLGPWAGPIR